jgi:MATE family multidrug resistance protein
LNKRILSLAVPNILSNLSVPLLSSVDTAVVGHLDKVSYLGAIAVGSMIFNFIYWGFGFLRMGTTGLTAQAYGSKNSRESYLTFSRASLVALISGIALMLLQDFIIFAAFQLVNSSEEVEYYARQYFHIRIYAAPATLLLYVFHGWFLGIQNAKVPLFLTVVVNVFNIFFNLLFIYRFAMKSDGVALGTVISQYIGLILAILIFYRINKLSIKLYIKEIIEINAIRTLFNFCLQFHYRKIR